MMDADTDWVVISVTPSYRKILELELVLTAMGITAQIERDDTEWLLLTRREFVASAQKQLSLYQHENRFFSLKRSPSPVLEKGYIGCIAYLIVIWVVWLVDQGGLVPEFQKNGVMWAYAVREGEWWRCFTALLLHGDFVHLIGNSVSGLIFGWMVARYVGSGAAWFLIFLCGALGNFFNAYLQHDEFVSIGASTAVFAAVGLLSGLFCRRRFIASRGWKYNLIPIVGALGLFAFIGIGGENTDIVAHLTGLTCGILVGLVVGRFDFRLLGKSGQIFAGIATGLVLFIAVLLA